MTITDPELLAPLELRKFIDTADGPVHYVDTGVGPSLLFISAWGPQPGMTSWLTYRDVISQLAGRYRCLAVDLPNFGLTGPVVFKEPAHDVAARAALAVLDAEGLQHVPVIGSSMGATTALCLALSAPERVESLVIGACHASTGGDPYLLTPFPSEAHFLFGDAQDRPDNRGALYRLLRSLVYDRDLVTDRFVDAVLEFRAQHRGHLSAARDSVSVAHSNVAALSSLTMPALVIHGRFDRMVPFEQALMILSHLPQADLVVLNQCGHWPPFERPDDFATQVQVFLARVGVENG